MRFTPLIFFGLLLFSLLLLSGCTENNLSLPYTTSQLINRSTDLNYSLFLAGDYNGLCLRVDNNVLTAGSCGDSNISLDWSSIVGFPVGCGFGQAVQVIGATLTCVDINSFSGSSVDTNLYTAQILSDQNVFLIDLNSLGNVKADGNYLCDSEDCYLISDLNESSGGTPAGDTNQIQFNNGGTFGADENFLWKSTLNRLIIGQDRPTSYATVVVNNQSPPSSTYLNGIENYIVDDIKHILSGAVVIPSTTGISNYIKTYKQLETTTIGFVATIGSSNTVDAYNTLFGITGSQQVTQTAISNTLNNFIDVNGANTGAFVNIDNYASKNYVVDNLDMNRLNATTTSTSYGSDNIVDLRTKKVAGTSNLVVYATRNYIQEQTDNNSTAINAYGNFIKVLSARTNTPMAGYGVWVDQIDGATRRGIVLDQDGAGGDIWFGEGQDATISYDGTDLVINPKVVGSGALSILGNISLLNQNMVLSTTTGTKFGTATNQKLSFFNATPVIQQIATTDLGTVLSNLGLRASGTAYPITTSGAITFTNSAIKLRSDSSLLYFGTGDDASINYDGTNLVINPKVVGSGKVNITGNLDVNGDLNLGGVLYGGSPIKLGNDLNFIYDSNIYGVDCIEFSDGYLCSSDINSGGGSQTPWTSDIDGGTYFLSNIGGINDSSDVLSIDPNARILYFTDGVTPVVDWYNGYFLDSSGNLSFEFSSLIHASYDLSNVMASDFGARVLYRADSSSSIAWDVSQLHSTGGNTLIDYSGTYDLSAPISFGSYMMFGVGWDIVNSSEEIIMSPTNRTFYDSAGNIVYNFGTGEMFDTSGVPITYLFSREFFDSSGNLSLNTSDRILIDGAGVTIFDWTNGYLNDDSGNTLIYFFGGNAVLRDITGVDSVNWNNRTLNMSGTAKVLDWENSTLNYQTDESISLDWFNALSYDTSATQSINWDTRTLFENTGNQSINWGSRVLTSSIGDVLDWENSYLYQSGIVSLDWFNRKLFSDDGSYSVMSLDWYNRDLNGDWDVNGNLNIDGNVYYKMPHLFGIADSTQAPTAINTWKAVDFNFLLGDAYGFSPQDSNCIVVHQTGHYFASFELQFEDSSPAPTSSVGVRISQNGSEVAGSYSEVDMVKQDVSQEITTLSYIEANEGDVLCMEWITSDIDVNLQTSNTWADQNTVAKGFINWVHPDGM